MTVQKSKTYDKFPVDFYADPIVEAGRVFHHINNFLR